MRQFMPELLPLGGIATYPERYPSTYPDPNLYDDIACCCGSTRANEWFLSSNEDVAKYTKSLLHLRPM